MDIREEFKLHIEQLVKAMLKGNESESDRQAVIKNANDLVSFVSFEAGYSLALRKLREQDEGFPPCDYCQCVMHEMPWHGSGVINGVISRHIHACNDCRGKLPAPVPPEKTLKLVRQTINNAIGFEFKENELQTVNESDLLAVFEAGIQFASKGE